MKMGFVFPGQGSQFVGMGQSLYNRHKLIRQTYEQASEILDIDISKISFEGPLAKLSQLENLFPAIVIQEIASYRSFMKEYGTAPQICAGHSLGEYAALHCSGALSFKDTLLLVRLRGRFAQTIVDSGAAGMSIVDEIAIEQVENICKNMQEEGARVWVSCRNSPTQTAICGRSEDMKNAEDEIASHGGKISPLFDNAPFHCQLMQEFAAPFEEEINKCQIYYTRYPVISGLTGKPFLKESEIRAGLVRQLYMPINWINVAAYMKRCSLTHVVEMSGKNILTNLVKDSLPDTECLCYGHKQAEPRLRELILEDEKVARHIPTVITKCLKAAVATPNENFDEQEYEEGVIKPYRKIVALQEQLEVAQEKPSKEYMNEALVHLKSILDTKRVSIKEQYEWLQEILDETGTRYLLSAVWEGMS